MTFQDPRHAIINKAGYTKFIPQIAENISPYAAMFLAELLNSDSYWLKNKKKYHSKTGKDYTGSFFHNRSEIKKRTGLSPSFQRKAQKALEDINIISVETKGLPRRNYFTINYEELDAFLLKHMNSTANDREDEPQEVNEENNHSSTGSTSSRHPGERLEIIQDDDINKNKGIKKKNKSKVNPTYIPDGTDTVDAYYQELGFGSIYSNDSCIKKKSSSPPGAQAQNGKQEALEIINEYNSAMDIHIRPGELEISNVLEKLPELREIKKYFTPDILSRVWNNLGDEYTRKLENKRISAFIKCKLLDQLQKHQGILSKAHDEEIDSLLDKVYLRYGDQISSQVEDLGFVHIYGSLEPIDASMHFPPKAHRKLRLEIYHKHIKQLLPKDEKQDMIKLEVF